MTSEERQELKEESQESSFLCLVLFCFNSVFLWLLVSVENKHC